MADNSAVGPELGAAQIETPYAVVPGSAGGDGGSVNVVDTVNGATGGILHLTQNALGGHGARGGGGPAGKGGDAVNNLTRPDVRAGTLDLHMLTQGGNGGDQAVIGSAGAAGNASSTVLVTSRGALTASIDAQGGLGGSGPYDGADGGQATVDVVGTANGSASSSINVRAVGGNGGIGGDLGYTGGDGGSASVSASGNRPPGVAISPLRARAPPPGSPRRR